MTTALSQLETKRSWFLRDSGRSPKAVTMNPVTWDEIRADVSVVPFVRIDTSGIFIYGMKVFRSTDVAYGAFYFSPQM